MFRKFPVTTLKSVVIASLVLVFALSLAWGVTYYSNSKVIGDEGGLIKINQDAEVYIHPGALDAYLVEEGLDRVKITVEMIDLAEDAEVGNIEPVILALEGLIISFQNVIGENSDNKSS